MIVDAPWYVPNTVIRRDLQSPIRHYSSQYSARLSAHTKRPSSEPHGETKQAIAETPAR
jgi:hypothetical protein